ncbi:hypothetical protein BCU68_06540 [Vibrio sp. 10N.286.49.B3]|uniref:DUF3545 family protein n=1 Tax=Vibrio sp. 10N.286.49.B3 TaxID=1880855 RepID=UPI000C85547C|nr:DUF3545 family protein [Vibrio sp. 10N.286.49.B3]PMH39754.1 hypothetical protein BCU68_06540 [Vibrio sp. 10N.286.49.B3]
MDSFQLDDIMDFDSSVTHKTRTTKPAKRKWREIEAIKDRRRLQKELMDIDMGLDFNLEDIKL